MRHSALACITAGGLWPRPRVGLFVFKRRNTGLSGKFSLKHGIELCFLTVGEGTNDGNEFGERHHAILYHVWKGKRYCIVEVLKDSSALWSIQGESRGCPGFPP